MKLTDRKKSLVGAEATDLIHIVKTGDTSQNSAGSSYKIEMGDYISLFSFNGGSITGNTVFNGGITANSITTNVLSSTTINSTNIVTDNLSSTTINSTNIVTDNLSATTISATTYLNLPLDIRVTGGTYSSGTATFTNNTGGTFNVTGFSSGSGGDTYWISGTTGSFSIKTDNDSGLDATGDYSHAEGYLTLASGEGSHAEGAFTTASGYTSHAEGYSTQANGMNSHSEGSNTTANGVDSHAEGTGSIAIGDGSHAEGGDLSFTTATKAVGKASHAEGAGTTSFGNYSHAQGVNTIAGGLYSHAGGYQSQASGITSFIHGYNSKVIGDYSIVLGRNITGNTADTTYVDNLNIKTVPAGTSISALGVDASGNVIVSDILKFLPKNRGYITGYDIVGDVGALSVSGDITVANAASPVGLSQLVTCTMANAMPNTNYKINVSIESLGTYDIDNNQLPVVWRPISTTQFVLFFEETATGTHNLRVHLEVIDLN